MTTKTLRSTLATTFLLLASAYANAGFVETVIIDNDYTPTDLDALWVDASRGRTLVDNENALQIGTGDTRRVMIEDGIGNVSGFDHVTFELSLDINRNFPGNQDRDISIGIHDGDRHLLFFGIDQSTGAVFGDTLALSNGQYGIGLSNGGPNPPETVREIVSGAQQDSYDLKFTMDATGLTTLELLGPKLIHFLSYATRYFTKP